MHVNLVVPDDGEGDSGQGRYTESLAAALQADGVCIHRTSFRYLPLAGKHSVARGIPIGATQGKPGAINHLVRIKGASSLLSGRLRPSVVTVHDLGMLYCPEDQSQIGSFPSRQILGLSLFATRRADHVIAVSEFTRSCLIRAGFAPERVTAIPLGVDLEKFTPRPGAIDHIARRYGLSLPSSHAIILYVGNELPRKNLGTLVESLALLKQFDVPFRWLKVGASIYPPGRAELVRQIEHLNLEEETLIIDRVPEADLPLFYAAADVFVQPSVWEGFGLPVLEAMASGAPVVSSSSGSLPEVCGDAAAIVDARNPQDIARAVMSVLEDSALRTRLRAAGPLHARRFTWATTAARTREVYRLVENDLSRQLAH